MSSKRIALAIVGLSLLIIGLIFSVSPRPDPGGHQRALEDAVKTPSYQPTEAEGSPSPNDFWLERQQTIRRLDHNPALTYDLLVPADDVDAPQEGWPVVVLALVAMPPYASVAQDGLGIVVKPQFTWNSFDEDRQILDATLEDIATDSPVNNQRLILHGCSVGGQFAFEFTIAEPSRVAGAVVMAAPDLRVPPQETWHIPFVFFYGDLDPFYDAETRAVIESMRRKMASVDLGLDAGQAHVCDPFLAIEAIRAILVE
jgi:predicted esterase